MQKSPVRRLLCYVSCNFRLTFFMASSLPGSRWRSAWLQYVRCFLDGRLLQATWTEYAAHSINLISDGADSGRLSTTINQWLNAIRRAAVSAHHCRNHWWYSKEPEPLLGWMGWCKYNKRCLNDLYGRNLGKVIIKRPQCDIKESSRLWVLTVVQPE